MAEAVHLDSLACSPRACRQAWRKPLRFGKGVFIVAIGLGYTAAVTAFRTVAGAVIRAARWLAFGREVRWHEARAGGSDDA